MDGGGGPGAGGGTPGTGKPRTIIVGAGGMALAINLREAGFPDLRIYEKRGPARRTSIASPCASHASEPRLEEFDVTYDDAARSGAAA